MNFIIFVRKMYPDSQFLYRKRNCGIPGCTTGDRYQVNDTAAQPETRVYEHFTVSWDMENPLLEESVTVPDPVENRRIR